MKITIDLTFLQLWYEELGLFWEQNTAMIAIWGITMLTAWIVWLVSNGHKDKVTNKEKLKNRRTIESFILQRGIHAWMNLQLREKQFSPDSAKHWLNAFERNMGFVELSVAPKSQKISPLKQLWSNFYDRLLQRINVPVELKKEAPNRNNPSFLQHIRR